MLPDNDQELFDFLQQKLYAAVLADALDRAGYRNQAMDARIRPLDPETVLVGRAATQLAAEEYAIPSSPYQLQIEAVDSLKPGDVVVATTQGSSACAYWGELFSAAARARGARGAVIDGYLRDVRKMKRLGWPVFGTGMRPLDSMGRLTVIQYNTPIRCGGVLVRPGDLIFGEIDGVVVVPREIEREVITAALEKATAENTGRRILEQGGTLRQVWDDHRVL